MKKAYLLIVLVLMCQLSFAQWNTSGNDIVNSNSGNVTIGANPLNAKFSIYQPNAWGSNPHDNTLLMTISSTAGTGNLVQNHHWLVRNSTGSDWFSVRLHDGVSIDNVFTQPQINTLTWWERDPYLNIQSWGSGANAYLTINQGNVGIGTTNPSALLHINGPLNGSSSLSFGSPNSSGNINVPVGASTGGYNMDFYTWRDVAPDQIGARIRAERINNFQPNNALVQSMDLTFSTSDGWLPANLTEKLRITSKGNVGIGTTTPGAALSIFNSTPTIQLFDADSNPADGSSMGKLAFGSGGAAWASVEASRNGGYLDDVSDLIFKTSFAGGAGGDGTNIERMRINHNGFVGIGTITPDQKLVVNGNIKLIMDGNSPIKNVSGITELGYSGVTGAKNWALRGVYQYWNGVNYNADGGDLDIIKSLNGNTILATKTDGSALGSVAVGTVAVPLGYRFAVAGNAIAESMTVKLQANWPDYVFKPSYNLMPLAEVKTYIDKNQHLPEIPSAAQIEKDGINLGEMNKILVKKVEELTLYLLELKKENEEIKQQIQEIKNNSHK